MAVNTHLRPVRKRLADLLDALEDGLVERSRQVRLALLAALAGEHTLLIGPPGTDICGPLERGQGTQA